MGEILVKLMKILQFNTHTVTQCVVKNRSSDEDFRMEPIGRYNVNHVNNYVNSLKTMTITMKM